MKPVSKTIFVKDAKNIILNDEFISVRNADKLTETVSFHDVLDMSSLDIAALLIGLEQIYNVGLQWATDPVDSINDVYVLYLKSLQKFNQQKRVHPIIKQR